MPSRLPRTRGEAMHNVATNFPMGTVRQRALNLISANAVAAWRHHHHGRKCSSRFAWKTSAEARSSPKATLMVVSNGPRFFASEWTRLFVAEVVARSRLFAALPAVILRRIVDLTSDA